MYVTDSLRQSANDGPLRLVGGRLGHYAGICNWVLVGVLVCDRSLALDLLPDGLLLAVFGLVPLYSLATVVVRLYGASRS